MPPAPFPERGGIIREPGFPAAAEVAMTIDDKWVAWNPGVPQIMCGAADTMAPDCLKVSARWIPKGDNPSKRSTHAENGDLGGANRGSWSSCLRAGRCCGASRRRGPRPGWDGHRGAGAEGPCDSESQGEARAVLQGHGRQEAAK